MRRESRLDSLRVVAPCSVPWESMAGDDAVRFCDKCRKSVYDVAGLAPAEAVALIERAEGRLCLRLTRRVDGRIVTGDCWAELRRARKRGLLALALAAPTIIVAELWSQGFGLRALQGFFRRPSPPVHASAPAPPPRPPDEEVFMGLAPLVRLPPRAPDAQPPKRPPKKRRAHRQSVEPMTITLGGIAPRNDNAE
jgi:hypothetical protein